MHRKRSNLQLEALAAEGMLTDTSCCERHLIEKYLTTRNPGMRKIHTNYYYQHLSETMEIEKKNEIKIGFTIIIIMILSNWRLNLAGIAFRLFETFSLKNVLGYYIETVEHKSPSIHRH